MAEQVLAARAPPDGEVVTARRQRPQLACFMVPAIEVDIDELQSRCSASLHKHTLRFLSATGDATALAKT
jgi:hypothetical protein